MNPHEIINLLMPIQAFVVGVLLFKHLDKMLKVVLGFVLFAIFTETFSLFLIHVLGKTTLWVGHFYAMIEFLFWAFIYSFQTKAYIKRTWFWSLVVAFELFCIVNMIFIQDLNEYSITRSIEGILLILFSIISFYKLMVDSNIKKLISEPFVWINSAVLFYFASNVFFHVLFTILLKNDIEFLKNIIRFYFTATNFLFYLLLSISFYVQKLKRANLFR